MAYRALVLGMAFLVVGSCTQTESGVDVDASSQETILGDGVGLDLWLEAGADPDGDVGLLDQSTPDLGADLGQCSGAGEADAGGCNDGNACTREDRCLEGVCVGTSFSCNEHGDCNGSACDCAAGFGGDYCGACAEGFVAYPACVSQTLVWYDSTTEKLWQITPPEGDYSWLQAKAYCEALDLAGLTGWHLPTISELRSLIRGCPGTMTDGACAVSDSCLEMLCLSTEWEICTPYLGPDEGCYWPSELEGFCFLYWSSSLVADYQENAWGVNYDHGDVGYLAVDNVDEGVRCVR